MTGVSVKSVGGYNYPVRFSTTAAVPPVLLKATFLCLTVLTHPSYSLSGGPYPSSSNTSLPQMSRYWGKIVDIVGGWNRGRTRATPTHKIKSNQIKSNISLFSKFNNNTHNLTHPSYSLSGGPYPSSSNTSLPQMSRYWGTIVDIVGGWNRGRTRVTPTHNLTHPSHSFSGGPYPSCSNTSLPQMSRYWGKIVDIVGGWNRGRTRVTPTHHLTHQKWPEIMCGAQTEPDTATPEQGQSANGGCAVSCLQSHFLTTSRKLSI
ncbi:hypothetical protein J6590_078078 [Homalodisca vitripennis]|nr:hypothetical protein J6590_078078 [Homalodisca vitripennis]